MSALEVRTIQLMLAILEFFLINWLGKHSISSGYHQISFIQTEEDAPLFNLTFRILAPAIFLTLTATLWYAVELHEVIQDYWIVTVLYVLVRWIFNVMMGRSKLVDWGRQLVVGFAATGLSWIVAEKILSDRQALLPSSRGLTDELWIGVIGFLYVTAGRVNWPSIGRSQEERQVEYIMASYHRFRRKYQTTIELSGCTALPEAVSYSVMIYESFNRPAAYQWIEKQLLFPVRHAATLGPMQVATDVRSTDQELVRAGVERVNEELHNAYDRLWKSSPHMFDVVARRDVDSGIESPRSDAIKRKRVSFEELPEYVQDELVISAAAKYNIRSDYPGQVVGIFRVLRARRYQQLNTSAEAPY